MRKRRRLHRRRYVADGHNLHRQDELKPFSFSIYGYIHGFSRYLVWLEVASSNKKPELITKFHLDAVKINHFSKTKSPQNQGIERYWSVLQLDRLEWWRWFFEF